MRTPGFYWVKRGNEWSVGEWDNDVTITSGAIPGTLSDAIFTYEGRWFLIGDSQFEYIDRDFEEIDERRIERVV